jgi:hypothetical protein
VGANKLIEAIGAPLGDCLMGNIFKIFLKISSRKYFKIFLKLYYFVKVYAKKFPKNVIFKVFQVHLRVLLLFKNNCYKSYIIF